MNSAELKRAKREVRRRVLAARDALSEEDRAAAATAVARRALELPELRAARTVMAFSSFGSELSMEPLIERLITHGIAVALPRIAEGELEPRSFRPGDEMTLAWFGAREPAAGAPVDPRDLDAVITPAVAFDRRCARVGYGGGYYDRFFTRAQPDATRIGVAADVQVVDEALPAAEFDVRVHVIVTPSTTLRCGRAT